MANEERFTNMKINSPLWRLAASPAVYEARRAVRSIAEGNAIGSSRVPGDPLELVQAANQLKTAAEKVLGEVVREAYEVGITWREIGEAIYVKGTPIQLKNATHRRFGKPLPPEQELEIELEEEAISLYQDFLQSEGDCDDGASPEGYYSFGMSYVEKATAELLGAIQYRDRGNPAACSEGIQRSISYVAKALLKLMHPSTLDAIDSGAREIRHSSFDSTTLEEMAPSGYAFQGIFQAALAFVSLQRFLTGFTESHNLAEADAWIARAQWHLALSVATFSRPGPLMMALRS